MKGQLGSEFWAPLERRPGSAVCKRHEHQLAVSSTAVCFSCQRDTQIAASGSWSPLSGSLLSRSPCKAARRLQRQAEWLIACSLAEASWCRTLQHFAGRTQNAVSETSLLLCHKSCRKLPSAQVIPNARRTEWHPYSLLLSQLCKGAQQAAWLHHSLLFCCKPSRQ